MKLKNLISTRLLMCLLVFSFLISLINFVINICSVPAFYFPGAKRLPLLLHLYYFFEDKQLGGLLALGIIDLLAMLAGILWLNFKNTVFIPMLISYLLDILIVFKVPIPNPYGFSHIVTLVFELTIIVLSFALIILRFKGTRKPFCCPLRKDTVID